MILRIPFRIHVLAQCFCCVLAPALPAQKADVVRLENVLVRDKTGSAQVVEAKAPERAPTFTMVRPEGRLNIRKGEGLKTDSDSSATLVLDRIGMARQGGDAEIRVPTAKETGQSLELLKGHLFFDIDAAELAKRRKGFFRLKTPEALLAVKGTRFFVNSQPGKDVFGVHQGEVVILEPLGRKTVTLGAGEAVEVGRGAIGEVRPLTDDEVAYEKEQPGLSLSAHELLPVRPNTVPPVPPDVNAMVWANLILRDASTPVGQRALKESTPEVPGSGVVRLKWDSLPSLKKPAYLWSSGEIVGPAQAEDNELAAVALQFSVRVAGCSEIEFGMLDPTAPETFGGPLLKLTALPSESDWVSCLVEIPDGVVPQSLALRATPSASSQRRSPGTLFVVGQIEIREMVLLRAQKPTDP